MYILGQILGLIGTAVTIATPQFRTKFQTLFCNASVNALNALSFAMLGQTGSAVYLCLIAIVQTLVSMWHEKKQTAVMTWETMTYYNYEAQPCLGCAFLVQIWCNILSRDTYDVHDIQQYTTKGCTILNDIHDFTLYNRYSTQTL